MTSADRTHRGNGPERAVIPNHRLFAASHETAPPVKAGSPKIFSAYGLDRKKILGGLDWQAGRDKSPVGSWPVAVLPLRLRAAALCEIGFCCGGIR